jgi:hypothetical protein
VQTYEQLRAQSQSEATIISISRRGPWRRQSWCLSTLRRATARSDLPMQDAAKGPSDSNRFPPGVNLGKTGQSAVGHGDDWPISQPSRATVRRPRVLVRRAHTKEVRCGVNHGCCRDRITNILLIQEDIKGCVSNDAIVPSAPSIMSLEDIDARLATDLHNGVGAESGAGCYEDRRVTEHMVRGDRDHRSGQTWAHRNGPRVIASACTLP